MPLPLPRAWPVAPSLAPIVCVWGGGGETCQRARGGGAGSWAPCRLWDLQTNSPLALIAPPPSCLSAELGNGFEQPWVTWSSSSFNRLGPPRRGRSVSFRLLDLSRRVCLRLPNFTALQPPRISRVPTQLSPFPAVFGRCSDMPGVNGTGS